MSIVPLQTCSLVVKEVASRVRDLRGPVKPTKKKHVGNRDIEKSKLFLRVPAKAMASLVLGETSFEEAGAGY